MPQPHLKFAAPDGWTNDPDEMMFRINWGDPESEGRDLVETLELKIATPIMSETRARGASLQIFESGGIYYIWNVISGTVSRFLDATLDEIVDAIKRTGGTRSLRLSPCF